MASLQLGLFMLYSLVFVLAPVVSETFCPIQNSDCSQSGVPCTILKDEDCLWVPDEEDIVNYPGPVTNLSVEPYYLHPEPPRSRSKVNISWSLPVNDTHHHLTAFRVRLIQGDNVPYCFIFKFNDNSTWPQDVSAFRYTLTCEQLYNGEYTIDVTSIPDAPFSDMVVSAMLTVCLKYKDEYPEKCQDPAADKCWDTDIVAYNDDPRCTQSIRVVFQQAEDIVGIPSYQVALTHSVYIDLDNIVQQDSGKIFLESVLNISSLTLPVSERRISIIPEGRDCDFNQCRMTESQKFDITQANYSECTFIPPFSTDDGKKELSAGALVGIVLAPVIFAAGLTVIIFMLARKRRKDSIPPTNDSNTVVNMVFENSSEISELESRQEYILDQSEESTTDGKSDIEDTILPNDSISVTEDHVPVINSPKRTVYLLYSCISGEDKLVVSSFSTYLHSMNCEVIFIEQDGEVDKASIKHAMTSSDVILIINSDSTYWKVYYNQNPQCTVSTSKDIFMQGWMILMENVSSLGPKVIMCHFDYTKDEYATIPPHLLQFEQKINYKLMRDHVHLLCSIDPCRKSSDFANSDTRKALENAILAKKRSQQWVPTPAVPREHSYFIRPDNLDEMSTITESQIGNCVNIINTSYNEEEEA